jgi:hypothetical protein
VRVIAHLAGLKTLQDVLPLPTVQGSRFLILQDTGESDQTPKVEKELLAELLNQTLTLTDPPARDSR